VARNITEAKQYLVNIVKRIMTKAGMSDIPLEVVFRPMGGTTLAVAQTSWTGGRERKMFRGKVILIKVIFDEDVIRVNIYNIENPFFEDWITHELSHTIDEVKNRRQSTHRAPFRRIYKSLEPPTTRTIGRIVPPIWDPIHYYGGKGYGAAPREMANAELSMCQACRKLDVYESGAKECEFCGGDLIPLKKMPPKEVVKYELMKDKGQGAMQDYLRATYREHIPSFGQQRARRKKITILDKAKRMVGGKYG
jgi:predicted SprT family Zn-dependent metalloprotease